MKITFHVYQENGHIHKFIPTAAAFFQYHAHIVKYAAALLGKVGAAAAEVGVELGGLFDGGRERRYGA